LIALPGAVSGSDIQRIPCSRTSARNIDPAIIGFHVESDESIGQYVRGCSISCF
jgi:hypothetical protein